jgi:hypothetical protein
MPADQFKAVAGEEITEMMGWFSDFGCESGSEGEKCPFFVMVWSLQNHLSASPPPLPIADSSPPSTWSLC